MNLFRMWLSLAAVWFILPAAAAPAPAPVSTSQGPISDALRLRALLPRTAPLSACPAVMAGEGQLELERRVPVYVTKHVKETVQTPDGQVREITRVVSEAVQQASKIRVAVKTCKFYA